MSNRPSHTTDLRYPDGVVVGPYTPLGHFLHEMPEEETEKIVRNFSEGQKQFEEKYAHILENSAKFLVLMNGGGITIGVAAATALVSKDFSILYLLPGFSFFIVGLIVCGVGILSLGNRFEVETIKTYSDISRMLLGKMTPFWADRRMHNRRDVKQDTHKPALFIWSFIAFVFGATSFIVGLATPDILTVLTDIDQKN